MSTWGVPGEPEENISPLELPLEMVVNHLNQGLETNLGLLQEQEGLLSTVRERELGAW